MSRAKPKIAFVHNAYIEYRTPLFEKLSDQYCVNFFFERFDRSLIREKPYFQLRFLINFKIAKDYSFSPLLFFHLLGGKYNLFIAGAIGQVNTYVAFFVSRLLRKPFIFWDENWCLPRSIWRSLAWPFLLQILKYSKAVVVPGSKSKQFYSALNPSIKCKIFVSPNASLLLPNKSIRVKADTLRDTLKLKDKKVILYCGRLIKQKGFEYLVKAFAKLQQYNSNTFLLVVGGQYGYGQLYSIEQLRSLSSLFGPDKIHFTGWVSTSDKISYFLLADVVVVPSIFFAEGAEVWGFAVNEAMSVGKPVVATTAVGAAYDLIQNGVNGYIVPDKDHHSLFESIKSIIDNSSTEASMSSKSLEILYGGFTYEHMLFGFREAITFVLSDSKKEALTENTDGFR